MSLKRTFLAFAGSFVLLAMVAIGALVLMTTYIHQAAGGIEEALESVHVAEQLEIQLLSHNRASDPLVRASIADELTQLVHRANAYVGNEDERRLVRALDSNLDRYLRAWQPVGADEPALAALQARSGGELNALFAGVRQLIQVNLTQSRALSRQAERWDQIANLTGISIAILLAGGVAGLFFWIRGAAFGPAIALTRAIEQYGAGDRSARAPESGPLEFRSIAQRFNALALALEQQRAIQRTFLAGVAHDLRNPVAALQLSIEVISPDRPLPPEPRVRVAFERVRRQINRLDRMLNDFLDVARIQAGTLQLQLEECDPVQVVRSTVELFEASAPRHQLVLKAPADPIRMTADSARLEQVLNNLVSNAIKYSPDGGTIALGIDREPAGVLISVADPGVGMTPEDLASMFQPFQRGASVKSTTTGLGLGLFVSRRIVEAHGGELTVESSPGHGTTFSIHLRG